MSDNKRRMEAYFYSFQSTSADCVNKILSAVAWAGKAFHHTQDWGDEAGEREDHTGSSPVDWIQNAAKEAAERIEQDAKRIAELKELHRMQLASIAAISLCNTRTSAEKHRNILPEYRTPEFELVCDAVDREMGHREKVAELEADKAKLTVLVDELRHQIAGEWQPIETAPKDGTDLIVMYMHIDTQIVHNAFFASVADGWEPEDVGWWTYTHSEVSRELLNEWRTPTYWKPLPNPPDAATQEQGK